MFAESDLFVGKAFIIVAGLSDSPHSYFKRKERKFEAVFQGKYCQENLNY